MASQHSKQPNALRLPKRDFWPQREVAGPTSSIPSKLAAHEASHRLAAIVIVLAVVTIVFQLMTFPNHDVAWVLWGAREMLSGAAWGVDIIEPNPPLAWYLAAPTTAIANLLNVPIDWTFRTAIALAATASALTFAWSARRSRREAPDLVLGTVAAITLLLLPGREFGQREHLLVIAILPYLGLARERLIGRSEISPRTAIIIGIAAGLGFALKPYFLAVPLLVEVAVQHLSRHRVSLFRRENLAIGAVPVFYALSLLLNGETYIYQVIPLAQEIYWSFDVALAHILPSALLSIAFAAVAFVSALRDRDEITILLGAAFVGVTTSFFIQHKGYGYHLLPLNALALIMAACFAIRQRGGLRFASFLALAMLSFTSFRPVVAWWDINRPGGTRTAEIEEIRNSIAAHTNAGGFLVVSVHPYPAFPIAIYSPARYVSRTNSQWFLPAVVRNRSAGAKTPAAASIERHARAFILHDLANSPDLVIIDRNSARHTMNDANFDFLAFYQEDPEFRRAWKSYREIESLGSFRQFVRTENRSTLHGRDWL